MVTSSVPPTQLHHFSLEDWLASPPNNTEWVNGELIEKTDMTLKHSKIQGTLTFLWKTYKNSVEPGGEVYTDVPCRTARQGRSPDVAYLTPDLVQQFGSAKVLPQSFPLSAEIVSPTDLAEEVIAKAYEYLESGGEEVWLVYPEAKWIIVVTADSRRVFVAGDTAQTQKVLLGFTISVEELVA